MKLQLFSVLRGLPVSSSCSTLYTGLNSTGWIAGPGQATPSRVGTDLGLFWSHTNIRLFHKEINLHIFWRRFFSLMPNRQSRNSLKIRSIERGSLRNKTAWLVRDVREEDKGEGESVGLSEILPGETVGEGAKTKGERKGLWQRTRTKGSLLLFCVEWCRETRYNFDWSAQVKRIGWI